jgi:heme A synthase
MDRINDRFIFGVVVGVLSPLLVFGLIALVNYSLFTMGTVHHYLDLMTHILVSFTANVVLIRIFFVNLKFDKTGRGVLLITFLMVIVLFAVRDKL